MMTLTGAVKMIARKEITSVELTRGVLERIDAFNERMRIFITVTGDQAMERASIADREIAGGCQRPLQGVPVSVKDLYDTKAIRTTAGSKVFADRVPKEDAVAVKRLK